MSTIQILFFILDRYAVVPALSEVCPYKLQRRNTRNSYGYVIQNQSCAHGCCGTTSYCCSWVSEHWRTIGIGIGCTVAGLILLGVVICVCCVFRGRQSNKNRPSCESSSHRRETPGQRSRNITTVTNSHCIATISDEHRDPVTRTLPAYTPGPYINEAYVHDNIDIPPSYEEAVSGDPVATPRIEADIHVSQDRAQRQS